MRIAFKNSKELDTHNRLRVSYIMILAALSKWQTKKVMVIVAKFSSRTNVHPCCTDPVVNVDSGGVG